MVVDDSADATHSTDDLVAARAEGLTTLTDSEKLREAEGARENEGEGGAATGGGSMALTTAPPSTPSTGGGGGGVSLFAAASLVRNARAFQRRSRTNSFEGRGEPQRS